jgi:hypothetical protein
MIIYLDSNQFFRVFERESAALFPQLKAVLEQYSGRLAMSEVNMFEAYQGPNRGAISKGLTLAGQLEPIWLPLGVLELKEIESSLSCYEAGLEFQRLEPFLTLPEILEIASDKGRIFDHSEYQTLPISECFDRLFDRGYLITDVQQRYGASLNAAAVEIRKSTTGQPRRAKIRELFIDALSFHYSHRLYVGKARDLAAEVWKDAQVCPAFRLSFEAACFSLSSVQADWTANKFWDQRHMTAIPYVDAFVGADKGVRAAVADFDRATQMDYSKRLFRNVEQFIDRLAKCGSD